MHAEIWFFRLLRLTAVTVVALLLVVIAFLMNESWKVLHEVGVPKFFVDDEWHPTEGSFGMLSMLSASLATSVGAMLIAGPLGIGCAVFCTVFAPPAVSQAYRKILAVLAGIPSVVYGFWGLTVIVPAIAAWRAPGASLLAGVVILALMILPTVTLTSEASLAAVPKSYASGAQALGLSRGATILHVMLPAARGGIIAGIVLALARALGETMAVVMVSGNITQIPASVFDPVRTLTANIALEMAYAVGNHRSALFVSGLVLIAVVCALVLVSERFSRVVHHA
ncbi:phosphate ABC transporter permease subunit PstC [Herbaspirillum sp. HC18]|nr:phosphate ABC transporter permease subunit PstC [Herbaspirillum sp. HC18]